MTKKQKVVEIAGKRYLVDDDGCLMIWPVIAELFAQNDRNLLTDAQIAQVVSQACNVDFITERVRVYRHRYNRGDFNNGVPPAIPSKALGRLDVARKQMEKVQNVRVIVEMLNKGSDENSEWNADPAEE